MGRTTVDNYRMSWATEHVVFTNGDYSANYIPMKERDGKRIQANPGPRSDEAERLVMTVDDAGTLIGRRKMPASQLGEVEKDDNDNEIVAHNKKKEEKSNKYVCFRLRLRKKSPSRIIKKKKKKKKKTMRASIREGEKEVVHIIIYIFIYATLCISLPLEFI